MEDVNPSESCCSILLKKQIPNYSDTRIFEMALENRHNNCFEKAYYMGYKWNKLTAARAAFMGNLEMLKFARLRGCFWDRLTTASAAYSGSISCLHFAYRNGCPWDVETCNNAAVNGNLDCLVFAINHGCPVTEYTLGFASTNNDCFTAVLKKLKPLKSIRPKIY